VTPPLSVIMVNYYSEADIEKCVGSLSQYDPTLHYELIVVDNGSTGDSLAEVLHHLDQSIDLKTIHNPENVGFARACNQGIRLSQGQYILLLNPDILFVENSISKMIDFLDQHREAGVVGCRHMRPFGRHCVGDAGYYPSLSRAFNHSFFLSRLFPNLFKGIYLIHESKAWTPIDVDWVSGGCLLLRKEVLLRVGGMDEAFFLSSEDVEWCARIKKHGWRVYYLPFTHIVHDRRMDSLRRPNPGLWLKSQINLYHRDHYKISTQLFSLTILSGLILRSVVYFFLHLLFKRPEDKDQGKELLCSVVSYLQRPSA
jgi:GT2 family glycosyltransferase